MLEDQEPEEDDYSRTPSSYASSEGEDDYLLNKRRQGAIPKTITQQPKLSHNHQIENSRRIEQTRYPRNGMNTSRTSLHSLSPSSTNSSIHNHSKSSGLTKSSSYDVKPLPRMRSAPPPPPTLGNSHRKANAPSRPT